MRDDINPTVFHKMLEDNGIVHFEGCDNEGNVHWTAGVIDIEKEMAQLLYDNYDEYVLEYSKYMDTTTVEELENQVAELKAVILTMLKLGN